MSKVITAVSRNDTLVNRATDNLKQCIETIKENPEMIHNGGVIVIFCGEKLEGEYIKSWVKTYHSMDSTLKMVGAIHRAAHEFMHDGE